MNMESDRIARLTLRDDERLIVAARRIPRMRRDAREDSVDQTSRGFGPVPLHELEHRLLAKSRARAASRVAHPVGEQEEQVFAAPPRSQHARGTVRHHAE